MENTDKLLGAGTYEQKVYAILKACLNKGESIEIHYQFDFYEDIKSILYSGSPKTSELIKTITKIVDKSKIESIITYNYDDILEQAITPDKCHAVYDKSRAKNAKEIQIYPYMDIFLRKENVPKLYLAKKNIIKYIKKPIIGEM